MAMQPPMDPFGSKLTGGGVEGHGSEYLPQNQINVPAELHGSLLDSLHSNTNVLALFPKAMSPLYLRVAKNDFVVVPRITHPRNIQGGLRRPLIHSAWNGKGAEEVATYPGRPDLQMAALLSKWAYMGVAYDGMEHVNFQDLGKVQSLAVTVAGTTTHKAHEDMYIGAIVILRLPNPGERPMRGARDSPGAVKLIPSIKTPETVWKLVSSSVKLYLADLTDTVETRYDRNLREINPARNAYETFADAGIVIGLEFLKMLMDQKIIRVAHPARPDVEEHFSFRPAAAADDAIEGTPVLLGLAKAFGIIPPEIDVPGAEMTPVRAKAFHRLRKLMASIMFYDGTTRQHAFHSGIDPTDWTKVTGRQTPAQRVTQAQLNTPRDLVACLDDLRASVGRWCPGTVIQGGKKDNVFRLHQK